MVANRMSSRWRELVTGRRMLVAAMLGLAFNSLPFYTSGLFINALHADRGWSLSGLSLGPTLLVAIMALCAPLMGYAFDRYGERRFILPGLVVQAVGFLLLSRIDGLTGYWLAMSLIALLGAGSTSPAYLRIVNRTFDRSKGAAMALTITGGALFAAIAPPLLQALIADHGWRAGYIGVATVALCGLPIIALLLGRAAPRPEQLRAATPSDFRYRDLVASPAFLILSLAIFAVAVACPGLMIHFATMLTAEGFTARDAAWMISIIGTTQIVSRLATGVLMDRFFAPRVAAAIMAASGIGIALLNWGGIDWAVAGAIAVGLAYGAESDLGGYFAGRYYPSAHFGRVFGAFYAVFLIGAALSPTIYGVAVDRFGSYTPALTGASILLLIAALLFLRLPAFPADRQEAAR